MNRSKSFWAWLRAGIGRGLKGIYDRVHEYWYAVSIYIGSWITLVSLVSAGMYYRPTWVSTDYAITGSYGYLADPKIMPWMIFWPVLGIAMFMSGLYGYWRKEVKT